MHTRVVHAVTGAEWDCPTKALAHFLSLGWELPTAGNEDNPATEAPQDAEQSPSPKSRSTK